ncbi:MAG: hypothetical protein RLZZ455_235 [Candidatus Parcubacteria bacterium]|jgi:hypothetical protein
MPEKPRRIPSPAKAAVAVKRPRDENGHFIKSSLLNIAENKTANDETLVDVKVTNPLRKITQILQQIKHKQSTVVDFKFTIPLVALPLFMLLAFSLGKSGGVMCGGNTQTKLGLLYTLRTSDTPPQGIMAVTKRNLATNIPFLAPFLITNTDTTINRQILIQRDNTAITIENPNNIPLTTYNTRQVFVTGKVNTCESTISIDDEADVQLLP